jgi:hypothetical protein
MSKSLPGPPSRELLGVQCRDLGSPGSSPQQADAAPVMTSFPFGSITHQVGDSHFRRGTMNLSGTVRVSFAPTGRSPDRFQYRCKVVVLLWVVYFDAEAGGSL